MCCFKGMFQWMIAKLPKEDETSSRCLILLHIYLRHSAILYHRKGQVIPKIEYI